MLLVAGLLAASVPASVGAPPLRMPDGEHYAQLVFRSRVVVRVQTWRTGPPADYREKKGPRCVAMPDILGAAVLARSSVDLVLRGGDRVRARFGASCPGLDYYSGFYIVPPVDAQLCAGRDVVRDRAGGECPIDKFRRLMPRK
jgi:hypothetical protein